MKNLRIIFLYAFFIAYSQTVYTQPPPPPSEHGLSDDQPAQQAPIGSGLAILAGLGLAYGAGKMYGIGKGKRLRRD